MEFKYILFFRLPFCRLVHFMCETECEESALHQSKRNCFLSYSDHFLISWLTIMQIFSYKISSHYTVSAGKISLEMGTFWLGIDLWLLFCSSAHTCRIFHSTPLYTSSYMQHNFYSWHDFFLQFSLPGPAVLECRDLCCNSSFSRETCCFCAFLMAFILPFSLCLVSHFSRS